MSKQLEERIRWFREEYLERLAAILPEWEPGPLVNEKLLTLEARPAEASWEK